MTKELSPEYRSMAENGHYFLSSCIEDTRYLLDRCQLSGLSLDSVVFDAISSNLPDFSATPNFGDMDILLRYGLEFSTKERNRFLVLDNSYGGKTYMLSLPETDHHVIPVMFKVPLTLGGESYYAMTVPREFSVTLEFGDIGRDYGLKITRTMIFAKEPIPKSIAKLLERINAVPVGEPQISFFNP